MAEQHFAAAAAQKAQETATKRQRKTPEQRIAYLQAKLARETASFKDKRRRLETREKIVIGGAVVKAMRENEAFRWQVVSILQTDVTREEDRKAIASWLSPTSTPR